MDYGRRREAGRQAPGVGVVTQLDYEKRIGNALEFAAGFGGIEGDHHKAWVIDQMVRALTGCPVIRESHKNDKGNVYTFEAQGESPEYQEWVREWCDGEDGPDTYEWDEGIAP